MIASILGWFSGVKTYAYIALGVVVLSLVGACGFLWEMHQADVSKRQLLQTSIDGLTQALQQSEADKALLARKAQELDSAIQERDKRLKALNETKRKLADELDRLKKSVSPEDRACLDRPLPDGILDLLRDGTGGDKDGTGNAPAKPAPAVPQV